jgi:hypothetical protein
MTAMHWALDPIDVLFAHPNYGPISLALFIDGAIDGARLRDAVAALVAANPILAARLERDDNRLVLAAAASSIEVAETRRPAEAWGWRHAPAGWLEHVPELEPSRGPLLGVTLVHIGDRAALVATLAHCLGDGVSALLVLRELARAYAGHPPASLPCDRRVLADALRALPPGGRSRAGHTAIADKERVVEAAMRRWPVEAIPDHVVDAARAADPSLTRFEIQAAYIAVQRHARRPTPSLSVAMPINLRGLVPGIPPTYLGNAVKAELIALDVDDLDDGDVVAVARALHDGRRAVDRLAFRDGYEQLSALYAAAGPDPVMRLRVSTDEAVLITDMSGMPDDVAFDGRRPDVVNFLSRYPNSAVISRGAAATHFQLGGRAEPFA